MATKINILVGDHILIDGPSNNDGSFHIDWEDKGKNWDANWCPSDYHAVIWCDYSPKEIEKKDPTTFQMTENISLTDTSDAVGTTTVANLLTWGETRKGQIQQAISDFVDDGNGQTGTNSEGKSWKDYDPNYS
tara:strand:- start:195 stop:593 length:399 start_codon:yes stop_codon:yes gene_type:complete